MPPTDLPCNFAIPDYSFLTVKNNHETSYAASTWTLSGTAPTVTKYTDRVEISLPVGDLGLSPGETFAFDVYTSGGNGSDGAVDALSASTTSISNWGDSFSTDLVGGSPNPALEFTMPGTAPFLTWIGTWGLDPEDQDPGDDPDDDNLTNQQEFDADLGLNPNDIDTDDDTLNDNLENGSGTYVSTTNTGTLPNKQDTDGDGFRDDKEVDNTALGYFSDPNEFNHAQLVIAGNVIVPNWDPTGTTNGQMTMVGTSLTEQYQWTFQDNIGPVGNYEFKFTNATDWADAAHWQWGSTGTPNLAARDGGNIGAPVPLSGIHTFTMDTATLAYSFDRTTFPDVATFLAAYGLSAGGDEDSDNILNEDEFTLGTDPTRDDTDGDGLTDDVENDTGSWTNSSLTGTDPLDADSDGDGLSDGAETNTDVFNGPTDTGTDPNKLDSDSDNDNDDVEIAQGTDPNDILSSAAAFGIPNMDGTRDALYGAPIVLQTIETGFGAANQLDAAYATVTNGKLYLMVTGNLNNSFEKLGIFIDSQAGGFNDFVAITDNDNSAAMNGMLFDTDFAPEYHLIARRGSGKFDFNFGSFDLDSANFYENVFGGTDAGSGITGTGVNTTPIRLAYDDSNTAGIGFTTPGGPADPVAAAAVTTGLELCIDLADLGNPEGGIKVMLLISNSDHNFLSNQTLAGLPETFGNLGDPTTTDFSTFAGDQFFSIPIPGILITDTDYLPGTSELQFTLTNLVVGTDYKLTSSSDLVTPFADVTGTTFTADYVTELLTLPVDTGTDPKDFFQFTEVPVE